MLFAVHALDKPGADRAAFHMAHIAHIKSAKDQGVEIVMGGPIVSDDGTKSIGSLYLLEAPDRAAADAYAKRDPFHQNGIWGTLSVSRYDKKQG